MPVLTGDVSFFFGAGASKPFGNPTMKEMTVDFKEELKTATQQEQRVYDEIVKLLEQDLGSVDIEAVFSVIDGLKQYSVDNFGELAIYSCRKICEKSFFSKNLDDSFTDTLTQLETKLTRFIRKSCMLKDKFSNKRKEVYSHFFNSLADASGDAPANSRDLKVKYSYSWTLFTTNYDNNLETFWREDVIGVTLDTCFNGNGCLYPDFFLRCAGNTVCNGPGGKLRLVKLHGSTSWLKEKDTECIKEKEYHLDFATEIGKGSKYDKDMVIYPLIQKQLYVEPYIQMFYNLNKDLENKRIWIVIGYSFRDPVIRNIFTTNFDKGSNKRMLLVIPNADEVISKYFSNYHDRIIPINERFGEDDYQTINQIIANQAFKR